MAGLLDALKQYIGDAMPGGLLNQETQPVAARTNYLAGLLDPQSQISQDAQNWHKRTQNGLADQLAGRQTPAADYAQQQIMNMAGVAPLGMFIGKGAKTWDAVSMGKAQQMAEQGIDPRAIWKETGTWQGPDGAWRQEIPDNAAKFKSFPSALDIAMNPDNMAETGKSWRDIFKHDALEKASYPEPSMTSKRDINGTIGASFDPTETLNSESGHILINSVQPNSSTSSALHELQHVIQEHEGWAKGGSVYGMARESQGKMDSIRGLNQTLSTISKDMDAAQASGNKGLFNALRETYHKVLDQRSGLSAQTQVDPIDAYRRLAGEAEARATQARINMDSAQRRATFPVDSYDVPLNQLIIRK